MTGLDAVASEHQLAWKAWAAQHERERTGLNGPLAIARSVDLTADSTRHPGFPGEWAARDLSVHAWFDEHEAVYGDREHLVGAQSWVVASDRRRLLQHGGDLLELSSRRGTAVLRRRTLDSELLVAYRGTPWFDYDLALCYEVDLVESPRIVEVGAVIDGVHHSYRSPGTVTFAHNGDRVRLTVFTRQRSDHEIVVIRDATSGRETYPKNRLVQLIPTAEGRRILDFNRAVNLPCAYNPTLACPLPPAENVLPFPIAGGQRTPLFAGGPLE